MSVNWTYSNGTDAIRDKLQEIYGEGHGCHCQVFRGFSWQTGRKGWHYTRYGQDRHLYLGKTIERALETLESYQDSEPPLESDL